MSIKVVEVIRENCPGGIALQHLVTTPLAVPTGCVRVAPERALAKNLRPLGCLQGTPWRYGT